MAESTAKRTERYIDDHPAIKRCLRKGLVNHAALAREISNSLDLSEQAVTIATRRYKNDLQEHDENEAAIQALLDNARLEITNRIAVVILDTIEPDRIKALRETAKRRDDSFYALEGSGHYTLILQEGLREELDEPIRHATTGLSLINLKMNDEIETTPGVMSYLTARFAQNQVNIYEIVSCWTDNIFVIESDDVPTAMEFLRFH